MPISNDKAKALAWLKSKKGLSLIELVVVTLVIAMVAALAFPTYKVFQQRGKEKRLKKILTDIRAAINGSKSHNSSAFFEEGFRTVARVKGMERILAVSALEGWTKEEEQSCLSGFVSQMSSGNGYPRTPSDIWSLSPSASLSPINFSDNRPPFVFEGSKINLERPFYRSKPIHPFHDWYENADFCYVPVDDQTGNANGTVYTFETWLLNAANLTGVKDIVSRGAGLSLDGSNTDDW